MKENRTKGGIVLASANTPNWDPFGEYGQGGSEEYPYRHKAEERILPPDKILKLKNPEVRIEPTNLCNYHCVMCPRETLTRPKSVMPMPFYESILDEVVLMGAKQITLVNFGESFCNVWIHLYTSVCKSQLGLGIAFFPLFTVSAMIDPEQVFCPASISIVSCLLQRLKHIIL